MYRFIPQLGCNLVTTFVNRQHKVNGLQIGLFNRCVELNGFQIGLWNVNEKRKLPIVNW